jgi:transposase
MDDVKKQFMDVLQGELIPSFCSRSDRNMTQKGFPPDNLKNLDENDMADFLRGWKEERGVDRVDDRRVISGIVHVLKSGCRWRDCPPEYGPPTTIYDRFVRWARRGVWENLFRDLARNGRSTDTQMIDSTPVKAHRSAEDRSSIRSGRHVAAAPG